MIEVRRLGHATLTTPDLDRQVAYYTAVVGLTLVERDAKRAFLASKQGLEAIALEGGPPNALSRLAFQVALKLGHVAYRVNDVQQVVKFYADVLGFRVSDWRDETFAFLRCGPDHHTVNFVVDEIPQLHHIAFEVKDWAEIQRACEWLAKNNIHLVWGPGRHIIGHNIAIYHRNADKVRVEFFCEMDLMKDEALGYFDPRPWHQDRPQRPKVWGPDTLRNYWGFGSERIIRGYQTVE